MAELSLEELKKLSEEFNRLKELIEAGMDTTLIKDQLSQMGSSLNSMKDLAVRGAEDLKNLTKATANFTDGDFGVSLSRISQRFKELRENISASNEELAMTAAKMIMLSPLITQRIPLPEAFAQIGKSAEIANSSMRNMLDTTLKLLSPDLAASDGFIVKTLQETATRGDFAKNLETNLLMGAAATGEFSEALATVGTDLSGMSLKIDAFSELFYRVGNASGLSTEQVAKYADQIRMIPGAMDNFRGSADLSVDGMHFLDAAIKVASGTGQEFSKVVEDMSFMFDNLGVRGRPALEIIARMQSTSDAIDLPLAKMRDFTQDAANAFKFLGDNAQGAISIMEQLGPALQQSGLGPAAINDLVKGVTSGISQMTTAQKAFLSSQTGGPGGLQGAFQVDLLLRQGKVDEVFGKVEENLKKQLGGPIVSLEEAARDAGAAAQFQRQLAFVKSPAMGGIARSDAEAMRILEALSARERGDAVEGKTPEAAFSDAIATGDKLQERQNNLAVVANNIAERSAQIQSVIAYNTSRQIGSGGSFADYMRDLKSQSSMAAAALQPIAGQGRAGGQSVDEIIGDAFSETMNALGDVKGKFDEFINSQSQNMQKTTNINLELNRSTVETPNQFAAKNIAPNDNQQVIGTAGKQNAVTAGAQTVPATSVEVTTVCQICQTRTAEKAAQKAVQQYHNATEQAYRHNHQPVF